MVLVLMVLVLGRLGVDGLGVGEARCDGLGVGEARC